MRADPGRAGSPLATLTLKGPQHASDKREERRQVLGGLISEYRRAA
jgi:hypothetical protein